MSALSEDTIKLITLGYLKSFYRMRPRVESQVTITGLDMRGEGDVIADGFLRFGLEDGTFFNATFEATSQETRDEILYRPRHSHAFWDALVLISLTIPILFAIAHISGIYLLVADNNDAFYSRLLYMHLGIFGFTAIIVSIFRRLPRYRNIHAVEQFKQYHANDQWVAYGYDVFDDLKPKYKRELVKQCTRYGFGLIEITEQNKPKLIIAPSHAENFIPRKAFLNLLPDAEWQDKFRRIATGPWVKFKGWLKQKLGRNQSEYFKWFPRNYYNQWSLVALGILSSWFFIRIEHNMLPFKYPHEKEYKANAIKKLSDKSIETTYFKIDAPIAGFYDSLFAPYEMHMNEEQFQEIIQTATSNGSYGIDAPIRIISSGAGEEMALYYNCERFHGLNESFYLLTDTLFDNIKMVRERITDLNDKGLNATAVWPPCLGGKGGGFLLYVDEFIIDSTEAVVLRDSLQLQLDSLDRSLKILHFTPIVSKREPIN